MSCAGQSSLRRRQQLQEEKYREETELNGIVTLQKR
jgi:hypothetical protein